MSSISLGSDDGHHHNHKTEAEIFVNKQQPAIKKQTQQAIKLGDLCLLQRIVRLFKVAPNEEITNTAKTCTALHYACSLDSAIILDYLLQLTYTLYKDNFSNIINAKTSEGWNLVMITAVYGATNSLNLLLKYGGVRLYEKDHSGLRAADLALKYKNESVHRILSKQSDQFPIKTITEPCEFVTPLNHKELLKEKTSETPACVQTSGDTTKVEDREEHQELLRHGKRLPCNVCSGEKGWMKYSECCGHPMHPTCVKGMKTCPQCNEGNLRLTTSIRVPENAFVLLDKTLDNHQINTV